MQQGAEQRHGCCAEVRTVFWVWWVSCVSGVRAMGVFCCCCSVGVVVVGDLL